MVVEAPAGQLGPARGVGRRHPWIPITDKAADWEGKWFDGLILIVGSHGKLGADGGQQGGFQLWDLEHPVGGGRVELAYDIRKDIVRVCIGGRANRAVRVQHHVVNQVVLEGAPALQDVRWFDAAATRVTAEA